MTGPRERRGFTVAELAVGIAVLALLVGCLAYLQMSVSRAQKLTSASHDGMQTVMSAMDVVCDDLSSMIYQRADDLRVADDCRSMTFLVAQPMGDDLYHVPTQRVTYALEPTTPAGAPFRLIRVDAHGRAAVGGVLLANMECLLIVGGPPFKRNARLQITLVGWRSETGKPGFSATQTKPIQIAGRPAFGGMRHRHHQEGES